MLSLFIGYSRLSWRERPRLVAGLVLALIVTAVYLPMLRNGFVYDSESQVLNDPFIHDPCNWADVLTLRVLSRDVLDFNRPMNLASLMADSVFWKKNPFGYHLTNLLLHVANCVMLFVLLGRPSRTGDSPSRLGGMPAAGAFVAALFFGLHPVNVEAVAEVAYREDLLVVFFSLAGLLIAGRWRRSLAGCFMAIACFLLAAASKETGILTPLWLAAALAVVLGGVGGHKHWRLLLGGTIAAVGLFAAARFHLSPGHSAIFLAQPPRLGGGFLDTLLIQTRIWAMYFRQIVFPIDLCADYGPYSLRNFSFIASFLALLGVAGIQIFLSLRSPLFAFGAVTFWFFLLPASNLLPMFRPMADRFLYFPMIGVALMLASLIAGLSHRRMVAGALACALIAPLAARTFAQERIWHDSQSLWKATLETNPASITALNNLAGVLVADGKPEEALGYIEHGGLALRFQNAETFAVKAVALDAVGRQAQADAAFKQSIQLDVRYAKPALLVQGLTWNRRDADKLQIIANRN